MKLNEKEMKKKVKNLRKYIEMLIKLEFSSAGGIAGYTLPLGMKPPLPIKLATKKKKKTNKKNKK